MDAIFRVDGASVVTSPDAAGPWDPRMQHGLAPASLVVWAAEAIPTPLPMHIARVTIDLMRPVPVAPDGAGLAMSRLADQNGYFGRAVQSLVIEKR